MTTVEVIKTFKEIVPEWKQGITMIAISNGKVSIGRVTPEMLRVAI